jgi:hypothetical protein
LSLMDNFEWVSGYTYVLCVCHVWYSYSEFEIIPSSGNPVFI